MVMLDLLKVILSSCHNIFGLLKNALNDCGFCTNSEVMDNVQIWFLDQPKDINEQCIHALVK